MLQVTATQVAAWRAGYDTPVTIRYAMSGRRPHVLHFSLAVKVARKAAAEGHAPSLTIRLQGTDRLVVGWEEES